MKHIFSVLVLSAIFTALFWSTGLAAPKDAGFVSPLPDFLIVGKNKQATFLDLWLPFLSTAQDEDVLGADGGYDLSELTSESVLMYDLSTGTTLFEKNSSMRIPMASLTKIMTAIVALEDRETESYTVSEEDLVGENSMGLLAGEVLSKEELLYGLLLPSGNDAAEVLARSYADGGREGFIRAMNDKASALGLVDTNFTNPSGLQGDGEQYTTVYDLLVITRYALENFPLFATIVATGSYEIGETSSHQAYSLLNETNLVTTYPGVKGVKTGYTPEAGYCLVTYLDYGGHRIIGVILKSENRRLEMKELLDYSLRSLGIEPPEYTGGL
jgi:D-alanyl-D-alanine carboxypeptidase (penicillin-binding protein 5/6)